MALSREEWSEAVRGDIVVEVRTEHAVSIAELRAWLAKPSPDPQDSMLRQEVQRVLGGGQEKAPRRGRR
jgi:hypothetical protein